MDEEVEELQKFHDAVREIIISLLFFILLYVSSYNVLSWFKKRTESEDYVTGEDDAFVFRIALWLCTFTLAVSAGAVLLLPISIVSNEVLLLHPHSYYVKWLNSSLIHGLWNYVFLCSNVALFVLMPFAYFFTESEGFSGSRNGIMARIKETTVMLILLGVTVFGVSWVLIAIFDSDNHSNTLSVCTPVGFAKMFTSMAKLVFKPQFLRDIKDELHTAKLSEETYIRKLRDKQHNSSEKRVSVMTNGHSNHSKDDMNSLQEKLNDVRRDIKELERKQQKSCLQTFIYAFLMVLSFILTVIGVSMVAQNMLQLLVGIKALPVGVKEVVLGITSLSAIGWPGSILETILIFVLLILSSALPVLSRTLGITNFDLVGDFGTMDWLGNFYIIFMYNLIFEVATVLCLWNKFKISSMLWRPKK
ncbi:Limb region 1 -like protein [Mactra antiquata]